MQRSVKYLLLLTYCLTSVLDFSQSLISISPLSSFRWAAFRQLPFHVKERVWNVLANNRYFTDYSTRNILERSSFELQEYYWVTPKGLNMEVLISQADREGLMTAVSPPSKVKTFFSVFQRFLKWITGDWNSASQRKHSSTKGLQLKPPLIFIHGSFHSAWCFAEHFMPYFTKLGHDCYAVSLRGTAATGMPPNDPGENVKIEDHLQDISYCLDTIVNRYQEEGVYGHKPVLIGHSVGGLILMKLLENKAVRERVSGVALLCSVPPSGNGAMINRFIRKDLWKAIRIVWGFVFKKATTSLSLCRDIFFDRTVPEKDMQLYMKRFQLDSRVSLDLQSLLKVLPSITSMDKFGKAVWLNNSSEILDAAAESSGRKEEEDEQLIGEPLIRGDKGTCTLPARLVIGAETDYIVDVEGLKETATYLGINEGPIIVPDLYHDVMLGPKWRKTAKLLSQWINTAILRN